ncbi:hypothetical protein D6853_13630 [Butyrivibrio sp. X503]|uniref:DUF6020 family protein n=1 Tax=Butyrivibrio sp. X503 TaxID=2364878 RepID=UPI000EA98209|nr:DUF6020 family protein [Butyrivibrio sp. X503]RKM54265.1 hypothetical protein D6853_13630 [Butyrivibrio sp. X503]
MTKNNLGLGSESDNNIKKNVVAWLLSGLFGVLAGAFNFIGYSLEKFDSIKFEGNMTLIMLFIMVILTIDARYVWKSYEMSFYGRKLFGFIDLNAPPKPISEKDFKKRTFFTLILLNLPVLLAEFPGFFVYDAQDELNEVLTRSFTTHHPLLHVLLLGGTIALVHKLTGSWNIAIFTYIVLQMLVITLIMTYVINYLRKRGIGKNSIILWTLYYGVFPTIVMYTLCSSKDGLFSAFLLLMTVLLIELVRDTEGFMSDKKKQMLLLASAVLMPLMRHNGFYAYLVFIPFALIYFRKKISGKLVGLLVIPIIIYLIISTALSAAFTAGHKDNQEMLTVPIMQMARVYKYDKEEMTEEEKAILTAYIPEKNLEKYTPRVSDLVKVGFNNALYEQDKKNFWKLWTGLFKKHPMTYINAWFLTSYGYWYPPADINVYKGNTVYTFTYDESSYFGYEVELPGERISLIPPIDKFYRYISIGSFHKDAPVIAYLFSPGLLALIYLFVFLYRLNRRNFGGIVPFLPVILTWLTVLLGPTYLVRYVVILWLALPLLTITGDKRFD